ncbi:MAG: hypothetical protein ACTS3F_01190 [Phycisphaerales bacterium]
MNGARLFLACGAGAAVLGLVWWTYQNRFAGPMEELRGEISQLESQTAQVRGYLDGTRDEPGALAELRGRSLGSKGESVVHELRVVLRSVGERAGLAGVSADSRPGRGVVNPVASAINQGPYRELRNVADLVPVTGSLRGVGSYESGIAAVAMLSGSDRLLRVDSVRMSPVSGDDRSLLDVRIEVTTVFAPGHGPEGSADTSAWLERMLTLDEQTASRVASLGGREPFMPPPPPPPQPAPVRVEPKPEPVREPPPVPKPPPPAYGEWRFVGVLDRSGSAEEGGGGEVLLVNGRSGERRRLRAGESVLGVVFVGVDGNAPGRAMFEREGARLTLRVGQTLGDAGEKPE